MTTTTNTDTNTTAPTTIGLSPSGVVWVAYDPAHVERMRQALAALWSKASVRLVQQALASDEPALRVAAQVEVDRREQAYLNLRAQVMRFKGRRNTDKARANRSQAVDERYWAMAERLADARRKRVR